MKSSQVLLAAAALGAAFVTTVSAASSVPNLRSAVARNRHVVVVYSLGDLMPGRILVATRAQTAPNGKLLKANVRLNEQLTGTKVANGYRMRTRHTLGTGRYYVQVSGVVVGLDCTPKKPCKTDWSNVRRVVSK
ncbi:MAG: hypothetical protein E6G24_07325 [Actinobacteria bacterium]|nr:MAG: hypothetical protein E6G24_07325 [Actinomycetota bacterium]